ncbi:MAG: apolipoprotein N-acyltransferase [Stigonema ocellatum SAG 48.90 = DSM 106950]|nr:apolipoprotein N-acyltransferase [Stigonema ocellatum SAG 48.90 = DSM 106950]
MRLKVIFQLITRNSDLVSAFVSGILMGLTVAPVGAWFLAWIALAPLWVLIIKNDSKNSSFLIGLVWGIGYHGVALSWITGIHPMTWMGIPWVASLAIALFCWTFITLWGAILVATWAMVMRVIFIRNPKSKLVTADAPRWTQIKVSSICVHLRASAVQNPYIRVLIGIALWCSLEALWNAGSLDWSHLSYTQSPHNLVILHLGQLSGQEAVTAAIVAVNGFIAEAWINRQDAKNAKISSASLAQERFFNKYLAIAAALLITCHLLGFALYSRPLSQSPEAALKVGIIQGNIPNQIKLYPEGFRRAIEGYTTGYLTLANQGVDAVLTPEGALPFSQYEIMRSSLVAAVREKGVVAWIGGFDRQGSHYTNSLFAFSKDGEIKSRYGKVKMVPIGEYIPFEEILGGIVKRLSPLDEHQVGGLPNQVFDTPFGAAIVGICYESAFPEVFRYQAAAGGEFILSSSNDAHFSAVMPAQHHAQDIMRAIETDRWAVRATNTGYSAFVDPHGRTLWISGLNTYEVHAETIYRRRTKTLYVLWGDWLTPLLLVLSALAWCLNIFWKEDDKIQFRQ